ncbi:MAG: hypothetical protein WCV68_04035 [Candidatus Paceibacterota bacterium]|jgi:hypothetical protein
MTKKRLGFFLLAGLLLASALVFLPAVKDGVMAETTVTGIELRGWSWSSNTGWLSFNSKDLSSPSGVYAVTMSSTTGALSGYAWSSSLGWIKFDPSLSGPSGNDTPYGAKLVDPDLKGWARACSVFIGSCSGNLRPDTERGGWDGWIKMINVKLATNASGGKYFSGYAWGDLNLGWINLGGDQGGPPGSCTEDIDTDCKNGPDCCSSEGPCIVDCDGGPTKFVNCHVAPSSGPLSTSFRWFVDPSTDISGLESDTTKYVYTWSGDAVSDPPSTGKDSYVTYTIAGPKTGGVTVVDSKGTSVSDASCSSATGEGTNVCVGDNELVPALPLVCCNADTDGDGKCGVPTACNLDFVAGSRKYIKYVEPNTASTVNIEVSTVGCPTTGNLSLSSTDLPTELSLVCSSSADGTYAACDTLTGGTSFWVGIVPSTNPPTRPAGFGLGQTTKPLNLELKQGATLLDTLPSSLVYVAPIN